MATRSQAIAQLPDYRLRKRYHSRLVKFGCLDPEEVFFLIKVAESEPQQLSTAQATTEEQYQSNPDGLGAQWVIRRRFQSRGCGKHTSHLCWRY